MTKTDLIDALAKKSGVEKRAVKAILEALTETVHQNLKRGREVKLQDLGKFKIVRRKARMGRNPQTGEAIKIPARKAPKFEPAKALKDVVAR